MDTATIAAALLLPRQWRNWVFVSIGYSMLFVITLSQVPDLVGTAPAFTMIDGSPVLVGYRMTVWSWLVLAGILWHVTVGTWRARLATARQRQHGYRRGEAPLAVQAVQAARTLAHPQGTPEPVAQRTEAPAAPTARPSVEPPAALPAPAAPQLVIPTVLGAGRRVQWSEDHGTFTVTDRRRYVVDEL